MKKYSLAIILFFTFFLNEAVLSQEVGTLRSDICYEIKGINPNYFIQVNGINYSDNEEAFLCVNDLPVSINIIYNLPGDSLHLQPIIATNWDWNNCNCSNPVGTSGTNSFDTTTINLTILANDFQVSFNENLKFNSTDSLELKVRIGGYPKYDEDSTF